MKMLKSRTSFNTHRG